MSTQRETHSGLSSSFFGIVGPVMTALKLKKSSGGYNPVSADEEGRIALTGAADDEASVGLLNSELKVPQSKVKRSSWSSCSLVWKAFGIVLGGFALWNAFKLIRWALIDAPTGLELMPAFSNSLGCLTAPFLYNQSSTVLRAPIGSYDLDHTFGIRGGAVGTLIIAQGAPGSEEIEYEMILRTDDEALLNQINIDYPKKSEDGTTSRSRLLISTPYTDPSSSSCMRYDIKMYLPPGLKNLQVSSHNTIHVQFDSNADVLLDNLHVTTFGPSMNNLILPHLGVRGKKMMLEVYRGWIVGDVAVVDSTAVVTQRGDGVANVRVHPIESGSTEPAFFRTTTGAGRTDVFYITPKAFKRQIRNDHISSRNADVYLTYREAEFNGRIQLSSRKYTATGLQPFPGSANGDDDGNSSWTHWRGDKNGRDEIVVKSRGWTGLYF